MSRKTLYDGTEVSLDTPTKLVNGERYLLTEEERQAREEEEAVYQAFQNEREMSESRRAMLAAKWPDPYALIDDILDRGIAAVKAERNTLKSK